MNQIHTWWDDAVTAANDIARETRLRHRVTAVRDRVEGAEQIIGWRVDLADGEHVRAAVADAFWDIVAPLRSGASGVAR